MNYHVFIVNNTTFQYHLRYGFAGTGAGNREVSFLSKPETSFNYAVETNFVKMIADISRIRAGDKILFYLCATPTTQGAFYGVFKASSSAFFDESNANNYLRHELGKPLAFRVRIEPDTVFPYGVSEHLYLDSLDQITHPHEMCWSMIYRKLKGNRGCTMITEYEFERLLNQLKQVNDNSYSNTIQSFDFNQKERKIEPSESPEAYGGATDPLDIKKRLLIKANRTQKFEAHFQAYIMQNYDLSPLRELLLPLPDESCWIGNEVSCGIGMQKIDILILQKIKNEIYIKLVELKCVQPDDYILERQLPWYIQWLSDYVVPNYTSKNLTVHLIPCVIALGENKAFADKCKAFKTTLAKENKNLILEPTEYISFSYNKTEIVFKKESGSAPNEKQS